MKWLKKMHKEDQQKVYEFAKKCFLEGFKHSNYEFNNEVPLIPEYHLESELFINEQEIETVLDVEFKKFMLSSINGPKPIIS